MYKILKKKILSDSIKLMEIHAPLVAKKAQAGQFIIFRVDEKGERVPLTIADYDREKGSVTIIFQEVGKSTIKLGQKEEGEYILDFLGPLGNPSHLEGYKKAAVIDGGFGTAISYDQAKTLYNLGCEVHAIAGFRNKDLIILEDELKQISHRCIITTDDGSNGTKGFVTDILKQLIAEGNKYDLVVAIGPLMMMKAVCDITREYGIKTIISMNPIMIDGTGMCGGCRIRVGGETKFACVDGPDFDGHLVDFDDAIKRQAMYKKFEKEALHQCRLEGMKNA